MCKICAIASRYQRSSKQESLLLNTDQFSSMVKIKQQTSDQTVPAFKSKEQNYENSNAG